MNSYKISLIFFFLLSIGYMQYAQAQACGNCATPNCTGIKSYTNKAAAQAGVGKVWKYYSPGLTNATGLFTTYATVRTDALGQVAVMQEIQVSGASTGVAAQAQLIVAARTYGLYSLSDVSCSAKILPNIANDGSSTTFNPAWTNLLPNTDYKLALTTDLRVMSNGYQYQGFNIRYYNSVRAVSSFTFDCGSASAVGTFYANGVGGQTGTLTIPITGATSGSTTFTISGNGFSGTATVNLTAGQTSVSIPLNYDGTGAAGNRTLIVTSSQGGASCAPTVNVKAATASFLFNCGIATASGTFVANGVGGQNGTLTIPLSNANAGQATFNVSGDGFTGTLTTVLTAGQASVSVPVTYDGSGATGNHLIAITSPQNTSGCAMVVAVAAPIASFTFNCGTATVTGNFVANNITNQGGFVTVPLTSATRGTASFTVTGVGFTGSLNTTLVNGQTAVTIPISYDGSGVARTAPLSITSTQGTGSCSVNATVVSSSSSGAITFNCSTTSTVVGSFVANGVGGQRGIINVNFTTQTAGEISLTASGNGFSGSVTATVLAGQTNLNMLVTYDGTGLAGMRAVTLTSSQATGVCSINVPIQALFEFNCSAFNTASNFIANGQSQTGTLVIPLSNVSAGTAIFALSGGGFTGSLTTILRDSQRFVAIPVTYDGSGASGSHSVTATSSQGLGSCPLNVSVKDPALKGCDYISGQPISIDIHSQTTNIGFSTTYILVDTGGIIRYSAAALPFVGIAVGDYLAYAVNYSGAAPTLLVGTSLNALGGTCVGLSNALTVKVCPAFQFNCGAAGYDGVFIANNIGGQTGTLTISMLNALPVSTTITVSGSGFSGTKTETLTSGQNTIVVPITYDGTGTGGIVPLTITSNNALGNCSVGVKVLAPPPVTPLTFNCVSAVLDGTFRASGATQSGSVTLNLSGVTANSTTNITISGTNFSGGLTNLELTAGQTSVSIPIEFNGASPDGVFTVTVSSPNFSNTCSIQIPVLPCIKITNTAKTDPTFASCPSLNDGTITVAADGINLHYSKDGGTTWQTSNIFTGLTEGSITIRVEDSIVLCHVDTTIVLTAPTVAAPTASVTAQPTCTVATGTITITAPTALGMTYSINGSTYTNTTGIFTGVAAGTYNITAKNSTGCISTGTNVTVNAQPPTPSVPTASVTAQPTCTVSTGTITISAPTGTGITYSIDGSTYTNTTGVFTGVAAGTYSVRAKNSVGCISSASSVTVNPQPPTPSVPTASVTAQPTCTVSTGTITITAPVGTSMLYSIDGFTYTNTTGIFTGIFTGVSAGTYSVSAKNSLGCFSGAASVTVNPQPLTPSAPTASVTSQPTCTISTGTITISAPTGIGMKYSIDGLTYTNTTGVFTGVSSGTYNVSAKNSDGCISSTSIVTVNAQPPTPSAPTASVTLQPTCTVSTGTITISAPTGTGMTYSIDGSTYTNTTGIFTDIAAGTYSVTAKNSVGCISTSSIVTVNVQPPTPSVPTASVTLQPTCTVSTGTITISAPTGTGMTYSIDGTTYTNTTGVFTSVAAGTYSVRAKNSVGCISTSTSVVVNTQPPTPSVPTASVTTQPTCTVSTGTITISAPTGTGMTYSIDGTTYTNTTGVFASVAAGTYSVRAKNSVGCISSASSVTVNPQPPTPSVPTASVTAQPTCTVSTGTITITAPVGTSMLYSIDGFTYTNTTGIFTGIFTGVSAGTYSVSAKNSLGCYSGATSVTVNPQPPTPSVPTASVTTQPTCTVSTGTITISAPTGTGMTYSIDGSSYTNTTGVFTGVVAGTYNVSAKNSDGCISTSTSVVVNAQPPVPSAPTASVTLQPTCLVSTGTITISAPTGTGITYSIDGTTYTNTTGVFTGVAAGTYSVTAKNSVGCISTGTNVTINAQPPTPSVPTASVTLQPTCTVSTGTITISAPTETGMTYNIDGSSYTNTTGIFTGVSAGTYNVSAKNSDGCISTSTSVTINAQPPTPSVPTASVTSQPTCTVSTGIITISAPTGTGMTYSIDGSSYTNTTGIFTGVSAGTYNVSAKNSDGCISIASSVTVNAQPPTPSVPTASVTSQPTCTISTGTITISAPTETGMTYSIDGSSYTNTTGIFTGVSAGTYNVSAKNSDGCISTATSVTINAQPPTPSVPTASVTSQPTCTVSTGTITISAPTGTGMTYSIDGTTYTNTTGIFTDVAAGTYSVTAKNSVGCISTSTSVTVNAQPPTPSVPTASVTSQPTCTVSTGIITISAPTGTGMTYSIDGSSYTNTTGVFTGVSAGTYNVSAKNSDGCISTSTSVTVNAQPPTPSVPTASVTSQPTCTVSTGIITISAPTGTGMTYSIDGLTYTNTTGVFTGVSSGTYNVSAKNSDGCISTATSVTINAQPPTPSVPTASVTAQPTCAVATGTITISAPTGTGMTYSIDGSSYTNTTGIFTGVSADTYNVSAKNSDGCISTATSVTVNAQPPTPSVPTASVTLQPTCTVSTGTITISAPTETGMTYNIDGSSYTNTTGIFTGVSAGTYNVSAKNSDGCISTATSVTVNAQPPTPSVPTASVTAQPTCTVSTGTITISAPTGTGMTYSIDGLTYTNTTGIFTGVVAGTYNVSAKNSDGCISTTASVTVNVQPPTPSVPTASVTSQPTCAVSTGTITISAPTGTGMTYSIDGSSYTNTTGIFTGVSAGTYNVSAKNSDGCISTSTSVTVNAQPPTPSVPTASVTAQPTCTVATGTITISAPTGIGMTYSIDGSSYTNTTGVLTGVSAGMYNVSAKNSDGCISTTASVTINAQPPTPSVPTASVTSQPTCTVSTCTITISTPTGTGMTYSIDGSSYTNTTGIFTGVSAGTYNVSAKNSDGCISISTSVTVNAQPPTPSVPTASVTAQPTCIVATGTITISAPTGTGITYSIDGSSYTNTTGIFTGVSAGIYNVSAKNSDGCISTSTIVTINAQPPTPSVPTASVTLQPTCAVSTGTITISAPTGTGITYSIDGSSYINTTGIFTGVSAGTYNVSAKNSDGCISISTSVVVNAQPPTPSAPTASVTLQPTCTVLTGTITISAPTGAGITYSIDGSTYTNTTGVFIGVSSGTYNVSAKNSDGCISISTSVTINAQPPTPSAPTASVTTQPTCTVSTGTITISAPTGTGMTYSIDGSSYTNTTGVFTGVVAGTYNVSAKNSDGCISTATTVTVNAQPPTPSVPTASVTAQPTCTVSTGTITISAPTGTGMTYSIDGSSYTNTTGIFTGVSSGTYNVSAKNSDGCISISTSVTINAQPPTPSVPTASVTAQPTCTVSTGTITISAPMGTGMTYSIDGSTYTNTTGIFTGVSADTYNVSAKNSDGCISSTSSVTVNPQPVSPIVLSAVVTPITEVSCPLVNNGIITINATGLNLEYSKDSGQTWQLSNVFTGLTAGSYKILVQNSVSNCAVPSNPSIITIAPFNCKPSITDSLIVTTPKDSTVTVCTTITDNDSTGIFSAMVTCAPQHGTVSPSVMGRQLCMTYVPATGYFGLDSACVTICDAGGLCDTIKLKITVIQPCTHINLKAFLEGPFNTSTNLMNTKLNDRGLLPGQTPIGAFAVPTPAGQPYRGVPWNYNGSETVTTYAADVVDWVLVSFRTSPVLGATVFRAAGLLHSNGTITFPDTCLRLPTGSFYIVIEHRNHLGIMSPSAVFIVNDSIDFDFTKGQSYVLTNPPSFGQKVKSNQWMMYAGDGKKTTSTANFDINFSDSQLWKLETGIFDQYRYGDFNMDADVNFNDSQLWKLNNGRYSGVPH